MLDSEEVLGGRFLWVLGGADKVEREMVSLGVVDFSEAGAGVRAGGADLRSCGAPLFGAEGEGKGEGFFTGTVNSIPRFAKSMKRSALIGFCGARFGGSISPALTRARSA